MSGVLMSPRGCYPLLQKTGCISISLWNLETVPDTGLEKKKWEFIIDWGVCLGFVELYEARNSWLDFTCKGHFMMIPPAGLPAVGHPCCHCYQTWKCKYLLAEGRVKQYLPIVGGKNYWVEDRTSNMSYSQAEMEFAGMKRFFSGI